MRRFRSGHGGGIRLEQRTSRRKDRKKKIFRFPGEDRKNKKGNKRRLGKEEVILNSKNGGESTSGPFWGVKKLVIIKD